MGSDGEGTQSAGGRRREGRASRRHPRWRGPGTEWGTQWTPTRLWVMAPDRSQTGPGPRCEPGVLLARLAGSRCDSCFGKLVVMSSPFATAMAGPQQGPSDWAPTPPAAALVTAGLLQPEARCRGGLGPARSLFPSRSSRHKRSYHVA